MTRESFVQHARQAQFDMGGLKIDFTDDGYQGSDLVEVSHLSAEGYRAADGDVWRKMLLAQIQ